MGIRSNAKTLYEKYFGTDWLNSIPAKWKAGLRFYVDKTPGVPNDTQPDPITGDLVSSQVTTDRTNELEKTNTRLNADLLTGATTHGQELDRRGFIVPFTEHLALDDAETGDANKQINPLNPTLSEVKEYTGADLVGVYSRVSRGVGRLELPPSLEALSSYFDNKEGTGQFTGTVGDCHWFTSGSWSYSLRGEGQGSAAIVAHCLHSVKQKWGTYVATNQAVFFMAANSTLAQILTRLGVIMGAAVTSMTSFNPTSITVLLVSQAVSLRAEAQEHVQDGGGGVDAEEHSEYGGYGDSREHSVTIEALIIPPCLHGTIALSDVDTAAADASADAGSNNSNPGSETVTGRVLASGVASSPTSIPTTGLKLIDLKSEPYYDVDMYFAEIVDMSLV